MPRTTLDIVESSHADAPKPGERWRFSADRRPHRWTPSGNRTAAAGGSPTRLRASHGSPRPRAPATLEGAVLAIAGADMLIVGGTSLAVYPAAGLIDYYQGGRLVLMNATPTPLRRARRPDHPRAHRPRLRADPGARVSRRHSAATVSGGVRQFRTRCPQR